MPYLLKVKADFDAAHYLRDYDGDCANLHGHRWTVEASFEYAQLNELGFACDFKVLKDNLKSVLPDHRCINDIEPFDCRNPTAENIAQFLYMKVAGMSLPIRAITVWETPTACVTYIPSEQKPSVFYPQYIGFGT